MEGIEIALTYVCRLELFLFGGFAELMRNVIRGLERDRHPCQIIVQFTKAKPILATIFIAYAPFTKGKVKGGIHMKSLVRNLLASAIVAATAVAGLVTFAPAASAGGFNVSSTPCSGNLKYSKALYLRNIYWSTPTASSLDYDDTVVAYAKYYYEPSRHTNCAVLVKAGNPAGADFDGAIDMRLDMERYGSPYVTVGQDYGRYSSYAGYIRSSANYNYRLWVEVGDYDTYDITTGGTETRYDRTTWSSGWA